MRINLSDLAYLELAEEVHDGYHSGIVVMAEDLCGALDIADDIYDEPPLRDRSPFQAGKRHQPSPLDLGRH